MTYHTSAGYAWQYHRDSLWVDGEAERLNNHISLEIGIEKVGWVAYSLMRPTVHDTSEVMGIQERAKA